MLASGKVSSRPDCTPWGRLLSVWRRVGPEVAPSTPSVRNNGPVTPSERPSHDIDADELGRRSNATLRVGLMMLGSGTASYRVKQGMHTVGRGARHRVPRQRGDARGDHHHLPGRSAVPHRGGGDRAPERQRGPDCAARSVPPHTSGENDDPRRSCGAGHHRTPGRALPGVGQRHVSLVPPAPRSLCSIVHD